MFQDGVAHGAEVWAGRYTAVEQDGYHRTPIKGVLASAGMLGASTRRKHSLLMVPMS